jgi:hypothetical protein
LEDRKGYEYESGLWMIEKTFCMSMMEVLGDSWGFVEVWERKRIRVAMSGIGFVGG